MSTTAAKSICGFGCRYWHLKMDPHRHDPRGTRTEVHGCDFYTFGDGKVIRKDSYWKIVE